MERNKVNQPGLIGTLAMLSLTLMGLGANAVTPALSTLAAHFEGKDVSFIQTIATFSMVAGSLVAGAIMGKRLRAKTLAVWGSLLSLVFGVLPVFLDHFAAILLVRLVFGFAIGLIAPLGNAMIMLNFEGSRQAKLIGLGTFAMNIGGIVFQMISGVLADFSWRLSFLSHSFFAVALVMAFFLPKEELPEKNGVSKSSAGNEKMNWKTVGLIGLLILVFQTVNLSVMMSASTIFEVRNAGGAAVAAMALTAFSAAGMAAGLVFGKVFDKWRRFVFPLAFAAVAIGAFVVFSGSGALVMGAGYALIGVGFNWLFAAFTGWVGIATPPSTIGTGTSVILAMMNLGGFFSSFWMMLLGYSLTGILLADVILCIVLAIVLMIVNPFGE